MPYFRSTSATPCISDLIKLVITEEWFSEANAANRNNKILDVRWSHGLGVKIFLNKFKADIKYLLAPFSR